MCVYVFVYCVFVCIFVYMNVCMYVDVHVNELMCVFMSVSGLQCKNLSVDTVSVSFTHIHTHRITAHMSMRPFLWVNIFLPASAWCLSAGSSLKVRALSDLEQGLRVGKEPISAILGQVTLSPLYCST